MDFKAIPNGKEKNAVAATFNALGQVIPDASKISKVVTTYQKLDNLLGQFQDLALNYSTDSPGSSARGNQHITIPILGTKQRTIPGSDLDSKLGTVTAQSGELATFFDENNRKAQAEILRSKEGLFNPKFTVKQNLQKIEDFRGQLNVALRGFLPPNPDQANSILKQNGINNFGGFGKKSLSPTPGSGGGVIHLHLKNGTTQDVPDTPEIRQKYGVK